MTCPRLQVNPAREKKLSNVRSKQADDKYVLSPPKIFSLEESIGYINQDECIEVTPTAIRLRKLAVSDAERKRLQAEGA
jgi:GTP-binding protein